MFENLLKQTTKRGVSVKSVKLNLEQKSFVLLFKEKL